MSRNTELKAVDAEPNGIDTLVYLSLRRNSVSLRSSMDLSPFDPSRNTPLRLRCCGPHCYPVAMRATHKEITGHSSEIASAANFTPKAPVVGRLRSSTRLSGYPPKRPFVVDAGCAKVSNASMIHIQSRSARRAQYIRVYL